MARQRFKAAPEVESIGRKLTNEHHAHLLKRRVEYVFSERAPKSGTKETWATARIVNGLSAFLANVDRDDYQDEETINEDFFVITVSEPVWSFLNDNGKQALIDHELCHCWVEEKDDGGTKLQLLHHDLEEFGSVVKRWGAWRSDVERFLNQANDGCQQGSLLDLDEPIADADARADEILSGLVGAAA